MTLVGIPDPSSPRNDLGLLPHGVLIRWVVSLDGLPLDV